MSESTIQTLDVSYFYGSDRTVYTILLQNEDEKLIVFVLNSQDQHYDVYSQLSHLLDGSLGDTSKRIVTFEDEEEMDEYLAKEIYDLL